MAAVARGGCLPLIVGGVDNTMAPVPNFAFLPYTESIDYCKVGFIVPLIPGRRVPIVPEMLDALESITASEWLARRSVAEGLRDAFRFRKTTPSAADHMIASMCRMATQARRSDAPAGSRFGWSKKTLAVQATPQMCPPRDLARRYSTDAPTLHGNWTLAQPWQDNGPPRESGRQTTHSVWYA